MAQRQFAQEVREVQTVVGQEVGAAATGDLSSYLAILTDDAIYYPPNLAPQSGPELQRFLNEFLESFQVEWLKFMNEETVVSGDLAYNVYSYSWRVTPRAGGEPVASQGKGLQVLRRSDDGQWKMARNIWNSTQSPTEP